MRILQVLPQLGYGGVEKIITNYYSLLDHKDFIFDFITHSDQRESYHQNLISSGSEIYYLKTLGQLGLQGYEKQIKEEIPLYKYDLIHVHTGHVTGLYAKAFHDCGAKKIITHAHTTKVINPKHKIIMPYLRALTNHYSNDRIACGHEAGEFCFGAKQTYHLLPNGLDFERFTTVSKAEIQKVQQELGLKDSDFVIGHIGRFEEQKNHAFIIEIIKYYLNMHDDAKFVLIGEGPLKERIQATLSLQCEQGKVIFTGSRNDIRVCMQLFDAFILPSLFEGLPLVSIEAQAAGLPCLFSNTIDKACDIEAGLSQFLDINQGPSIWVHALDKIQNNCHDNQILRPNKADIKQQLERHGYELHANVNTLAKIYRDCIES